MSDILKNVDVCKSLRHIKNTTFLENSLDPLTKKFVKEIWVYKTTKLEREKKDLKWIYYRDRSKNSVYSLLLHICNNNTKKILIIYFDDCVQHIVKVDDEFKMKIKNIK